MQDPLEGSRSLEVPKDLTRFVANCSVSEISKSAALDIVQSLSVLWKRNREKRLNVDHNHASCLFLPKTLRFDTSFWVI